MKIYEITKLEKHKTMFLLFTAILQLESTN